MSQEPERASAAQDDAHVPGFFAIMVVSAFALNWLWEMIQMPAFVEMAELSWAETALPCARAALGDVVMTLSIYAVGALASGNIRWGLGRRWNVYLTGVILGAVFATAFELYSQATDRWTYNDLMPIVPVLGVGMWPFLQLMLLVPASWAIGQWGMS